VDQIQLALGHISNKYFDLFIFVKNMSNKSIWREYHIMALLEILSCIVESTAMTLHTFLIRTCFKTLHIIQRLLADTSKYSASCYTFLCRTVAI
jgi:hypothetical protein